MYQEVFLRKKPLDEKIDPKAKIPKTKDVKLVKGELGPVFKFIVQRKRMSERDETLRKEEDGRRIEAYKVQVVELRPKMVIDDNGVPRDVSEFVASSLDHDPEWHILDIGRGSGLSDAWGQALDDARNTEIAQKVLKNVKGVSVPDVSHYEDRKGGLVRRIRTHAGDVDLHDLRGSMMYELSSDAMRAWYDYKPWMFDKITKEFSKQDLVEAIDILKGAVKKLHEAGYAHNNLLRNILISKKDGNVHVSIIDWDMMTTGKFSKNFEDDNDHLERLEKSLKQLEEIPKFRKWLKTHRFKEAKMPFSIKKE